MNTPTWRPGWGHRLLRLTAQIGMLTTILIVPLLGGWHRLERSLLSAWHSWGHDLPPWAMERLPRGETAMAVYEWLDIVGGGGAMDLATVPVVDPVAGLAALLTGEATWLALAAWVVPAVLALALGRVWCGWLCPFGTLSRFVDWVRRLVPTRYRGWQLPRRRPLRWILLGGSLVVGALGVPGLLYLMLPHVLMQQSLYAAWLLGGGGAALGAVGGLVLAGLVFGPTLYCSAVCPTGAALRTLSLGRLIRVAVADKPTCGSCTQCDSACWLGLQPSSGDPGPDCDLCARCFSNCPKANLRLTVRGRRAPSVSGIAPKTAALVAVVVVGTLAGPRAASAEVPMQTKPVLLMEATHTEGDVTVAASLVDWNGVRLSQDEAEGQKGVEISILLARGEMGPRDRRGKQESRERYEGPMQVQLRDPRGALLETVAFERPNAPRSAGIAALYRAKREVPMAPGSTVRVLPIPEWLPEGATWEVRTLNSGQGWQRSAKMGGAAFFVAVGLLSLALSLRRRADPTPS